MQRRARRSAQPLSHGMRPRYLSAAIATALVGCTAGLPDDLARTVLLEELPQEEGIVHDGFLACVAVENRDAGPELLAALREAHLDSVPASQCQWDMRGSFHRASKRKAMLVKVYGYKRAGTIEFEALHAGKYGTMKTLEVTRVSSGWRIVRVLSHWMARAASPPMRSSGRA
jgi:hypothetical protein